MRIIFIIVLFLFPSAALAEMYRYTDDQGVVILTDQKDSIPYKYKDRAEAVSGWNTPATVQNSAIKGNSTYRLSYADQVGGVIKSVLAAVPDAGLDNLKSWLAVAAASSVFLSLLLFIFIRDKKLRCIVGTLLISCLYLVLAALYMQRVVDRGGSVVKEVEKVKAQMLEREKKTTELPEDR